MPRLSSPLPPLDSWTVVDDGKHNAFTDLVWWRASFWLAFVSSPSHFANPKSRVVLLRSADGHDWQEAARFDGGGQDLRDPKLAVLDDRLFLYALLNRSFDPLPYRTLSAVSADGQTWSPLAPAGPEAWLLGRPKVSPGGSWVAPAHNLAEVVVKLFTSTDGLTWEPSAEITRGNGADETAIEFLPDGRLLAATRLEMGGGLFGNPGAGTLLSVTEPPYRYWAPLGRSRLTRLDGPNLFTHQSRVYAAGRFQPRLVGPFDWSGSALSRKRTALFEVRGSDLVHLVDLPSSGDTSYPGVAARDGQAFISYYTSPLRRDPAWLTGMLFPTSIRMAVVPLDGLE